MANNAFWEGLKQIIALIFVNVIALLIDPTFLTVAISIDSLVLGISLQAITARKTEERLDIALKEMINVAKLAATMFQAKREEITKQQERKVVV